MLYNFQQQEILQEEFIDKASIKAVVINCH